MAFGHGRVFTTGLRFVRSGRKAIKRNKSPNFCLWLQAVVRRNTHYVGFRSSSGYLDIEFPLPSVQRTHSDVPWMAAFDP